MGMSSPGNGRNLIRPRIAQKQAASREEVDMGQHHSGDFGRGYLELWTFESSLFFKCKSLCVLNMLAQVLNGINKVQYEGRI